MDRASSGGTGYQPTVKISNPELFLSKRTAGTTMETSLRERRSSDRPNHLKRRHQGLTRLLIYDVPTDRSLAWLSSERPYQQLTKTDADTYSQPLDEVGDPYGRVREKIEGTEGDGNPIG